MPVPVSMSATTLGHGEANLSAGFPSPAEDHGENRIPPLSQERYELGGADAVIELPHVPEEMDNEKFFEVGKFDVQSPGDVGPQS